MSSLHQPRLRLVGDWPARPPASADAPVGRSAAVAPQEASGAAPIAPDLARAANAAPAVDPFDPRWVLAVRTSERLQGTLLPPESREALLRLGRVLGLSTFDANLVIAIVQDQARRGHAPLDCPAAGAAQISLVAPAHAARPRRPLRTALAIAALLALELLIIVLVMKH